VEDGIERGLVFLAYQSSIVSQFEHVLREWINNPDFKEDGTGYDLLVGQSQAGDRKRTAKLRLERGNTYKEIVLETADHEEWVVPTGGGYFFVPSIRALWEQIATHRDDEQRD